MGTESLTSRAVIGRFYSELETQRGKTWNAAIATHIESDQDIERLPFLGAAPVFREWIGGRLAKGLDAKEIEVRNRHYEATLEVSASDLRRDKTGQILTRVADLARRAAVHPQALLSDLIANGHSSLCYDGQYFFDTDHAEGDSGTQSNDISIDITANAVPLAQQGTATAPSAWTLANAIGSTVAHMLTIKDDAGECIHTDPKSFVVMVPNSWRSALMGIGVDAFAFEAPNVLKLAPYKVTTVANPRLTWTDKFAVFRTDGSVRPLIYQQETEVELKMKAEGSEFATDYDRHQYGIDTWCAAAYGFWQCACRATLV